MEKAKKARKQVVEVCVIDRCGDDASWYPILVMYPPGATDEDAPAYAHLDMPMCHAHRLAIAVADILTDDSWYQMCEIFDKQGKVMPDRASIELDFKRILKPETVAGH